MRTIVVEPQILESSANTMDDYTTQYRMQIQKLYQEIEVMSSAWQGSDNVAFVNQIHGYHNDFLKIAALLTQYIEFLRSTARAYRQTQAELVSQATRLTN